MSNKDFLFWALKSWVRDVYIKGSVSIGRFFGQRFERFIVKLSLFSIILGANALFRMERI